MDNIAVLVPCYNEAKTIGKVISDFRESLPEAVIYVYDNNSTCLLYTSVSIVPNIHFPAHIPI